MQGDFGQSFYHHRPVIDVISERLPATIELSLVALIVALATAIPLGRAGGDPARTRSSTGLATIGSLLGVSLPGFWFGILLLMLFAVHLHVLPVSGPDRVRFRNPADHRHCCWSTPCCAATCRRSGMR